MSVSVLQPSQAAHAKLPLFDTSSQFVCSAVAAGILQEVTERDSRRADADMNGQPNGQPKRAEPDDSDVEEEGMVNEYREQIQYDEDGIDQDDLGYATMQPDIQSQLQAAVTPLEYGAGLDVKMASYDNYVSLFHYILNSDGPVDLDLPSVSVSPVGR